MTRGWYGDRMKHNLASKGVRTRRDFDSGRSKNLKMNDDVYKLRREVMKYIYEARDLCELPRIDIRITENVDEWVLGLGRMKDNIIWIPKRTFEGWDLRTIVFHEILHAVYGVEHVKGDKLMDIEHNPLTKSEANRLFKKWAKKHGGVCK